MFDLVAEGKQPNYRWRKKIRDFDWHMIGRQPGPYCVDWDSQLSRQHAHFRQVPGGIEVERFPNSTNPVFFDGRKADFFKVKANQHFVIGLTRFSLVISESEVTQDVPSPIQQLTFSDQFLNALDYRDANLRINVLSKLPELIVDAASEEQLLDRITNVLLQGVSQAEVVAIVSTTSPKDPVIVKHWDSRHDLEESFKPSESLIRQAISSQETVLHVWSDRAGGGSNYTIQQHADWAYVCPLKGTACRGQAVYVSGKVGRIGATLTTELLHDDLKFTQLVTSMYANVIELESLQRRQAALRTFFSPIVVEALAGRDPDQVLEPRACNLSVLFCDLRGFSATSERLSENLLELLNRVSRALGVMTSCILSGRGVVGDFHGDAVMGFWGWPLEQTDAAIRAVQTALDITRRFDQVHEGDESASGQFMMGLGIATGKAVAGKIGSSDQVKVTAFGPVVNLAARLEGMTRYFKVPVLCDEPTATDLAKSGTNPDCRIRRLARVVPHGFQRMTDLYQIIPRGGDFDEIHNHDLDEYAIALEKFENGNWAAALNILESLPNADLAHHFVADFIRQQNSVPPPDWDGSIPIPGK